MDQITESKIIGVSTPRVDGSSKVSGAAMYASDHHFPGLVYAWPVCATIANGSVTQLDAAIAEKMPGVVAVYHRKNIGKLYRVPPAAGFSLIVDERRPPFEDDVVRYYGQYVAVVVAQTVEQARAAAESVKVSYSIQKPMVEEKLLGSPLTKDKPDEKSKRGDTASVLQSAKIKVDAIYTMPVETHNPIELHASIAVYDGQKYTLYETSQAVVNHRDVLAAMLGVPTEQVQVITKFLGSGFGGKLWPWPQSAYGRRLCTQLEPASQAGGEPADDVPERGPSPGNRSTHSASCGAGWKADRGPAGLRKSHRDARRL